MSVWANHITIFVYGCFWGVLDNFRGDIKFQKNPDLGTLCFFYLKSKTLLKRSFLQSSAWEHQNSFSHPSKDSKYKKLPEYIMWVHWVPSLLLDYVTLQINPTATIFSFQIPC